MFAGRPCAQTLRAFVIVAAVFGLSPTAASAQVTPTCSAANITVQALGGPNFYIDAGSSPEFRSSYTGYRIGNNTGGALTDVWVQLSNFTGGSLALASGQAPAQRVGDLAVEATMSRYWYLTARTATASAQNHTITVYRHNPSLPDAVALCSTSGGFSSVQGTLGASANKVTGITVSGGAPNLGSLFTVTVTGNTGVIGDGVTGDLQSLWMSPAVAETWPAEVFRLVSTSLTISRDGVAAPQNSVDTLRVAGLGSLARDYTARYTFQAVGFSSTPTTVKPVQEISSGTQVKHTGSYSVALPAIQPPVSDLTVALTATPAELPFGGGTATFEATVNGTPGGELDGFTMTLPSGASVVPGTATWGGVAIPDPTRDGNQLVFTGPFVVGANTLAIDLLFGSTSGDRTVTLLGSLGATLVGTTTTPTDGTNPASASVHVDAPPTAADQTIIVALNTPVSVNIARLVSDPEDDPWSVATGPAAHGTVTVSGQIVTYTPASGWEGSDSFIYTVDDGRGGTATAIVTVIVDPTAPLPQTITFAQPEPVDPGTTFTVAPSSTADLPVIVTSETPEICTTDGTTVTAHTAGTCILTATQPGNGTYAPADPVTRHITINPLAAPQTITFDPAPVVLGLIPGYTLAATASSGLPVSYAVVSGDCILDGDVLLPSTQGQCTVTATQSGNGEHQSADPVAVVIAFVTPQDDAATTAGDTPVVVDVIANDPDGVVLTAITQPANGTTVMVDGHARYLPNPGYRGVDTFTYTVTRDGRSATASARVTVDNLAPRISGAAIQQVAGSTMTVALNPVDPNGDTMTLDATPGDRRIRVRILDNALAVTAAPTASGTVTVTVHVTDSAGATTAATVTTRITPIPASRVGRTLTPRGTTVRWTPAPTTGALYETVIDGTVACRSSRPTCTLGRMVGPLNQVGVRTLGRDGTASVLTDAPLVGHGRILMVTVYFATDSAELTTTSTRTLDRAIREVAAAGFREVTIDGFTDGDGNWLYNNILSRVRTRAVADYLSRKSAITATQAWHGERSPAAANTSRRGKAKNRRVEVLVTY